MKLAELKELIQEKIGYPLEKALIKNNVKVLLESYDDKTLEELSIKPYSNIILEHKLLGGIGKENFELV